MAGGSSAMEAYDVSWDRPHRADGNERWQESDCYWFYDATAGVGGFHRIGQQPNRMKGQVSLFVFALDGDRYVSNSELDYEPGERWAVGQRVGSHTAVSLKDKEMRFTWDEPESSADLHWYESFHEPRNWPLHARFFMSHVNSDGHLECGGRLRGMVRIGARTYQIDALAHRDRSWGYRGNETSNHRYRMFSGTVGPEFSVASYSLDLVDGGRSCAGHVIRNGVENDVVDLRCLTTFDADGFSPLGAPRFSRLILERPSGSPAGAFRVGEACFQTPSAKLPSTAKPASWTWSWPTIRGVELTCRDPTN